MPQLYWFQDQWLTKEEVRVSPEDRGYYFGDGIYEVFRVYGGRLYEAEAHFERLRRSAEGIRIPLPYTLEVFERKLEELIRRSTLQDGTVYLQITRGEAPRNHLFPGEARPVVMAFSADAPRPRSITSSGVRAVTAEDTRWLHCDYKTLNLLANVLARQNAVDNGADDVILHRGGTVTESSAANVMIVRAGRLVTHPANNLILHGITRAVVLRLAEAAGIPAEERPFSLEELFDADEAFLTGTTIEIAPILSVDGKPVGSGQPGPVTRRLQEAFEDTIRP